uniref:Tripartite motif containing 54 n=1 Tax=Ornithorhynchus anatinus TaxID=9258 RepID=A0A6I8N0R2_ORNAN
MTNAMSLWFPWRRVDAYSGTLGYRWQKLASFGRAMEALGKVLTCPICLDLFTPPVIVLNCSHNFCKMCLDQILLCQNCTHMNGQFCCPVCRKVIYLRGRGTTALQRNILVENMLEKFKDEQKVIQAKEQDQMSQMCETHREMMTLMCLYDNEPICGTCKLFGDHKSHKVMKISEAYAARKISFVDDLQLLLQKSESTKLAIEEVEKLKNELKTSTADTQAMIEIIGRSLINRIKCRVTALKNKLDEEHSMKLEKLKLVIKDLQMPKLLYQQMKTLLDQHLNAVHFHQQDKKMKEEMDKILNGNPPTIPERDNISIKYYFSELIKGMDIGNFVLSKTDHVMINTAEGCEDWSLGSLTQSPLSDEIPDKIFCQTVLALFQKINEKEMSLPQSPSSSSSSSESAEESDDSSMESSV